VKSVLCTQAMHTSRLKYFSKLSTICKLPNWPEFLSSWFLQHFQLFISGAAQKSSIFRSLKIGVHMMTLAYRDETVTSTFCCCHALQLHSDVALSLSVPSVSTLSVRQIRGFQCPQFLQRTGPKAQIHTFVYSTDNDEHHFESRWRFVTNH